MLGKGRQGANALVRPRLLRPLIACLVLVWFACCILLLLGWVDLHREGALGGVAKEALLALHKQGWSHADFKRSMCRTRSSSSSSSSSSRSQEGENDEEDEDGGVWGDDPLVCREEANRGTPRTAFTSKSEARLLAWFTFQGRLRQRAHNLALAATLSSSPAFTAAASSSPASPSQQHRPTDVLFFGDSITERWRGTKLGEPVAQHEGVEYAPALAAQLFRPHFSFEFFGMSGDQTQHLLWRLTEGGELPQALNPKVVVLLIGTNNLWAGHSPFQVMEGIEAVVARVLSQAPKARVLVSYLLPRDDCPPRCRKDLPAGRPTSLDPLVQEVNSLLSQLTPHSRTALFDCGHTLLLPGGNDGEGDRGGGVSRKPIPALMPDGLHPSLWGMERWGRCVKRHIQEALTATAEQAAHSLA